MERHAVETDKSFYPSSKFKNLWSSISTACHLNKHGKNFI